MSTPISFNVGEDILSGSIFFPKELKSQNPTALIIHGWKSRQNGSVYIADALNDKGYIVMTFDLRGHGESDGDITKLTRGDFLNDVVAAYDFLLGISGVDLNMVTAIGSSFGSYLATLLSSRRKVHSLVLRVPANYPDDGFDEPLDKTRGSADPMPWRNKVHGCTETVSLKALHDFSDRVLIIESEKDELVPHNTVQSYIDAVSDKSKLTYSVMAGAEHSLRNSESHRLEYKDILVRFIEADKVL